MNFQFVGNYKCLDFINTEVMFRGKPVDLLKGFAGLLEWLVKAEVLSEMEAARVRTEWGNSNQAEDLLRQAKTLRTTVKNAVRAMIAGEGVPESVVAEVNGLLKQQTGYGELVRTKDGRYEKRTRATFSEPVQVLVPLAESLADLLCYGDVALVRKCENPACVLYFYDTTKNHARRWCSMSVCGNRAKAAAHYQRKRQASTE